MEVRGPVRRQSHGHHFLHRAFYVSFHPQLCVHLNHADGHARRGRNSPLASQVVHLQAKTGWQIAQGDVESLSRVQTPRTTLAALL